MPKPGKGGGNGTISGNKRDNTLLGTAQADVMDGKAGNDTIFGLEGNDTLLGGDGNDWLDGGAGNDSIDGGAGTDTAIFSGERDLYSVTSLGGGIIQISGPDGTDTFTGIEVFQFSDMSQSAAEVVLPRLANLTAGTLNVYDTSLAPGEGTQASFHLASNGTIDAAATSFELLVATSPNEGDVISVLDTQTAGAIVTGDSDIYAVSIPADALPPGTYWVAVRVDATGALEEEDETDNLTDWVQITVEEPVADLRIASATINAASDTDLGYGGGQILVDYAIANVGNTGSGQYRIVAFLSRDGEISADDIEIAQYSSQLFPGGSATGQLAGVLDEGLEGGDWQVLTRLEWTGGETEATPTDNTVANAVTLTPAVADLRLNTATLGANTDLDLSGGGRLEMTYDWDNAGTGTPSYFTIRSYLSRDMTISEDDQAILGITGGTFTGQSGSVTTSYWFQPDFAAGDYYIISEIAWGDGSDDATPENNTVIQQVSFTPPPYDLAITNVTIDPASDLLLDADGGFLSYQVDVSNLSELDGSAPVTAYLSTDRSITADDIRIYANTGLLAGGESTTVTASLALDQAMAAGDYTLIVTLAAPDDNASNSIYYVDLTIEGPDEPPVIFGTEGADMLMGTPEGDTINALGGDDVIFHSAGFDVVDGGEGVDTADFSALSVGVRLVSDYFEEPGALFLEDNTTYGIIQTYRNIEAVIGTDFDDMVYLRGTNITRLELGAGGDVAVGSEFDDVINAGAGNDLIQGGEGDDDVTLGEGADLFGVVRYSEGPFPFGHGNDVISDFDAAEDVLYFQIENGTTYDPLLDTTQTAEGALISYVDGSSILLEGVDMFDLTAANFQFEDTIYTA